MLGPILFVLHRGRVANTTRATGSLSTKLPKTFHLLDISDSLSQISAENIRSWLSVNMPKLKDNLAWNKTSAWECHSITVTDVSINISDPVEDLGVSTDARLSMETPVYHLCQTCYNHLLATGKLLQDITTKATHALVRALVTSWLDDTNSILFDLSLELIDRIQKIQNTPALTISRSSWWAYHLCVLSLSGPGLTSRFFVWHINLFTRLLHPDLPTRDLRSNHQHLLTVSPRTVKSFG